MKVSTFKIVFLLGVLKSISGQWYRPSFLFSRFSGMEHVPIFHSGPPSSSSFAPLYDQPLASGSSHNPNIPNCDKGKHNSNVRLQGSATNNFSPITQTSNYYRQSLNAQPIPYIPFQSSSFQPSGSYQSSSSNNKGASSNNNYNNNYGQTGFSFYSQSTSKTPSTSTFKNQYAPTPSPFLNNNFNIQFPTTTTSTPAPQIVTPQTSQTVIHPQKTKTHQNNEKINITAMLHLAGAEEFKNCIPIPNSDGACFILQDDTKDEGPATTPKPFKEHSASKEIIYQAPQKSQLSFRPLSPSTNSNSNAYFNYQVQSDHRNPSSSNLAPAGATKGYSNNNGGGGPIISSFARGNNPIFDPPFNLRESFRNKNFPNKLNGLGLNTQSGKLNNGNGFTGESLPTPQPFRASPIDPSGDDRIKEGSEKVPAEVITSPFDHLPESREFYMRFLKLWAIYHKRYGCSSHPVDQSSNTNSS